MGVPILSHSLEGKHSTLVHRLSIYRQRCKDSKGGVTEVFRMIIDIPLFIGPVSITYALLDKRILTLGTMGAFYDMHN